MDDCIFCKIANHEIPSDIVYENEDLVCFRDLNPIAPTHILIVPKKHFANTTELAESPEADHLAGEILRAAKTIAEQEKFEGYHLLSNCGEACGQSVMHLHVHLIAGENICKRLGA